jgi:hypothetical protein
MKAYKRELLHFFSNKKEQDMKLKKLLEHKSFADKKEIIEMHRETTTLEQGIYSVGEHRFERIPYIRDIDYLELLKEEIKQKYLEFNKYKYDALYELIEVDEEKFDRYELEIAELKKKRDAYIRRKAEKLDEFTAFNDEIDFNIKQRIEEFNISEKEDKKEIYNNIILLKKSKFDKIEKHLSMMYIDNYKTLVTDYVPIRGNEHKILPFNIVESVEVNVDQDLELPVQPNLKDSSNSNRSSSNEE